MAKKNRRQKLLDKVEKGIDTDNLPYAMVSRFNSHNQTGLLYLEAAYKAGKTDLAEKVRLVMRKDLEQQKKYYDYLKNNRPELYGGTLEGTEVIVNEICCRHWMQLKRSMRRKHRHKLRSKDKVRSSTP